VQGPWRHYHYSSWSSDGKTKGAPKAKMVAAVTASEAAAGYEAEAEKAEEEAVAVVEQATAVGMRWEVMLMESAEVVLIEVVLQWDRACSPRART
jgi:hypothetical protein